MYKWYDTLKDPWRFLVFFIPTASLIVGLYTPVLEVQVASGILLLVLLITRMIYLHK